QDLAVTCIDEDAVQVPELPLDRGEHRVEVGEIADVRANRETAGSKCLLRRLQRPLIQAADGDARALSVEFLRRGQPDPAVAAGDEDILVRESTHCRHSFSADAAYQLRQTRFAESLLNGALTFERRSVWFTGPSMSARTPLRLYRSVRGYPLERSGFPPQSLRSDCAMSGRTHVVGPSIPHPVLH